MSFVTQNIFEFSFFAFIFVPGFSVGFLYCFRLCMSFPKVASDIFIVVLVLAQLSAQEKAV